MKKTSLFITVLSLAVALLAINFLAARHPLRIDLTKNRIYTLSDSTKKILEGLDDVVTIRAYFTKNPPPALEPLRRSVDDILSEFKGAGRSRLQIEFIDPGESKMDENKAAMLGIPPVQLNVVERDKQEVAKIYLGMAVMFGGKQQVLPVVSRVDNLEYDLAEAIIKVSAKELPKVAWWEAGPSEKSNGDGFRLIKEAISRRYELMQVAEKNLADLDAKKIAVLVLASPGKLSDDEILALDQYLMNGGRIMALIDRFEVGDGLIIKPIETNATDLLMHYGATIEDSIVADKSNAMAAFSGGIVTYHIPYPFWPDIRRGQFNAADPVVAELESVVLPWTSPLVVSKNDANETLASSSRYSVSIPSKDAHLDPQAATQTLVGGPFEERVLLAMLGNKLTSYFTTDKISPPKGIDVLKESAEGARIFVAGSSRWISDRVLQTFPANATLFENALDAFAMGDLLIGIRSRENSSRPIAVLSDGMRALIKYINLAVGPLAMVIIGLLFYMIRRARRRTAQLAYR